MISLLIKFGKVEKITNELNISVINQSISMVNL